MDIKNIAGFEKPLEKLFETISNGIGVLANHIFEFDAARAKRIGEAEAEVERKKIITQAEGQSEAIAILDRARKRFTLEQYNKQINFENILYKTKENLDGKSVSDEPVEKDWTARFFDVAQNVSREELQDLLAKILSGEVQKPGSYSYQTLEVIKYLSQRDLQKFLKFVAISTELGVIKIYNDYKDPLSKYGISFTAYLDLVSVGLFNPTSSAYGEEIRPSYYITTTIGENAFIISNKERETKKFNFELNAFTSVGRELRELLVDQAKNAKSDEYIDDFKEEAKKKGFKITLRVT